jgi:flagellar hook protein FlgE
MGFSTALSGLNAASNMLSVTGNNIANVNTTGFKKSRAEFADVYASLGGASKTTAGAGVLIANDAQLFTQGNLVSSDNNLDLGVSGEGFFVLGESVTNPLQRTFTRAGVFHADENGYIVNNFNQPLMCYRPNGNTIEEGFSTGVFQPVQVGVTQGQPIATSEIRTAVNLDSRKQAPTVAFSGPDSTGAVDPASYTSTASTTIYDSLGNVHIQTNYYVKMATEDGSGTATGYGINEWRVYTFVDGKQLPMASELPNAAIYAPLLGTEPAGTLDGGALMKFDQSGQFKGIFDHADVQSADIAIGTSIDYPPADPTIEPNAEQMDITLDLAGSTQLGTPFSVNSLYQNGLAIGRLTSLDINDQGVVFARFSNGAARPLGQVALARFQNPQGLSKLGDTKWAENTSSGTALYGVATTGAFGAIKSGNLESSNVDLSAQLVDLIVAQQAYQANAQTISAENEVTKTILQIR